MRFCRVHFFLGGGSDSMEQLGPRYCGAECAARLPINIEAGEHNANFVPVTVVACYFLSPVQVLFLALVGPDYP